MLKIIDILNPTTTKLEKSATIQAAFEKVSQTRKGAAVIVDEDKPIGIITERDVLHIYKRRVPLDYKAIDYATKRMVIAKEDRDLDFCMNLMLDHAIRRVIVVDENRFYKGVVTQDMLLPFFEKKGLANSIFAKDVIAGHEVIAAKEEDALSEIVAMMSEHKISIMPIVDDNNAPLGVITESDISRLARDQASLDIQVKEVMTKPAICVNIEKSLNDIILFMNEKNIRHMVVTDIENKVRGVMTNRDILRSLKGDYNTFLEEKISHVKKSLDLLSQIVIEVTCFENETAIHWGNTKAYETFGERLIDFPIEMVLPYNIWKSLYDGLKESSFVKKRGINIGGSVYDVTCAKSGIRNVQIILNDVTTFNEISKKYKDIRELSDGIKVNLELSEKRYRQIIELAKEGFVYFNAEGKIADINSSLAGMLGYEPRELIGLDYGHIIENKGEMGFSDKHFAKQFISCEITMKHKGGHIIPALINANFLLESGVKEGLFAFINDITEIKELQRKIYTEREYSKNVIDLMRTPIMVVKHLKAVRANKALLELVGMENIEEFNKCYNIVCDLLKCCDDDCTDESCKVGRFEKASNVHAELPEQKIEIFDNRFQEKRVFIIKSALVDNKEYILTFNDVTEIQRQRDLFEDMANFDELTKLYSRAKFKIIAEEILEICKIEQKHCSMIVFDIDNFKNINDTYGHSQGDFALKEVAKRAKHIVRKDDLIARWGGEEFVVLMCDADLEGVFKRAEAIREEIAKEPINKEIGILTCSFGVAQMQSGETLNSLFSRADTAMYRAKRDGKNKTMK